MGLVRALIHVALVAAFVLGAVTLALRRSKVLGTVALGAALGGALLGGSEVAVDTPVPASNYLGLDWFLLDLLMLAVLFVPLERIFPRLSEQAVFRKGWTTDLAHFLVSHLSVQVLMLLTLTPAMVLFRFAQDASFQRAVRGQPALLQFLEILVLADLAEYWIHRLFHSVGFLWRFHAVHHSSAELDWLAGSRLHLFDIVVTRAAAFLPLYALGFSRMPVYAYLVFVSFHAVFIHANLRFPLRRLAPWFGTPRFHHWHHSAAPEARDKNFAIHLPWIDRLFGTLYLPEGWPAQYGTGGTRVPEGFVRQLAFPLSGPLADTAESEAQAGR